MPVVESQIYIYFVVALTKRWPSSIRRSSTGAIIARTRPTWQHLTLLWRFRPSITANSCRPYTKYRRLCPVQLTHPFPVWDGRQEWNEVLAFQIRPCRLTVRLVWNESGHSCSNSDTTTIAPRTWSTVDAIHHPSVRLFRLKQSVTVLTILNSDRASL